MSTINGSAEELTYGEALVALASGDPLSEAQRNEMLGAIKREHGLLPTAGLEDLRAWKAEQDREARAAAEAAELAQLQQEKADADAKAKSSAKGSK